MLNPLKEEVYTKNQEHDFLEMLSQSPIINCQWKVEAVTYRLRKHLNGEFEFNNHLKREYNILPMPDVDNFLHFVHEPTGNYLMMGLVEQRKKYLIEVQEFPEGDYIFYHTEICKLNHFKLPSMKGYSTEFYENLNKETKIEKAKQHVSPCFSKTAAFFKSLKDSVDLETEILKLKKEENAIWEIRDKQ